MNFFRNCREDDFCETGIRAKNPQNRQTPDKHVVHGGKPGYGDNWISVSKRISSSIRFNTGQSLILIDSTKLTTSFLDTESIKILGATNKNFAKSASEWLIDTEIPNEAITVIMTSEETKAILDPITKKDQLLASDIQNIIESFFCRIQDKVTVKQFSNLQEGTLRKICFVFDKLANPLIENKEYAKFKDLFIAYSKYSRIIKKVIVEKKKGEKMNNEEAIIKEIEELAACFALNMTPSLAEELLKNYRKYFKKISDVNLMDKGVASSYAWFKSVYERDRCLLDQEDRNNLDDYASEIELIFLDLSNIEEKFNEINKQIEDDILHDL